MPTTAPLQIVKAEALHPIPGDLLEFLRDLGKPTLIELPGHDSSRVRVVTTLLHGNEASGAHAIHAYLQARRTPQTTLLLYLASIDAAVTGKGFEHRALPGVRDANRAFLGPYDDVPGRRARALIEALAPHPIEALLDLHNNTGDNPAYGVGVGIDRRKLNLTALFGDHYMNSDLMLGTIMEWAESRCPAVTIECGRTNSAMSDATATAGLERFTVIDDLRLDAAPPAHLRVLSRPIRVELAAGADLAVGSAPIAGADLTLRDDLDTFNFEVMPAGTRVGWCGPGRPLPVVARCSRAQTRTEEYFAIDGEALITRQPFIPVMMTLDVAVAKSDCLFYAMSPTTAGAS